MKIRELLFLLPLMWSQAAISGDLCLTLGAGYMRYDIATQRRASSSFALSGERDLGLRANLSVPFVGLRHDISDDWWWHVDWSKSDRHGLGVVKQKKILFGFLPVTVGVGTKTQISTNEVDVGVGKKILFFGSGHDLSLTLGATMLDYKLRITTPNPALNVDKSGFGGTLLFGLFYENNFAYGRLRADIAYSNLKLGESKAKVIHSKLMYSYLVLPSTEVGVGYYWRSIDVVRKTNKLTQSSNYDVSGFRVFITQIW